MQPRTFLVTATAAAILACAPIAARSAEPAQGRASAEASDGDVPTLKGRDDPASGRARDHCADGPSRDTLRVWRRRSCGACPHLPLWPAAIGRDSDAAATQATTSLFQQDHFGRAYMWNTFRPETEGQLYHGGGTFNTSSWISLYPRDGVGVFLVTPNVDERVQGLLNERANAIAEHVRRKTR